MLYADAVPPLDDVNRQLLNFIEVYEHNSSNFSSLQLTLWHLDPLRASAFVPLPHWIQAKKAVIDVTGTGDDCFKWVVFAGMHPVDRHADRMNQYVEHIDKYDFSSLHFPVPLFYWFICCSGQFIYQCIWYRGRQERDLPTLRFANGHFR